MTINVHPLTLPPTPTCNHCCLWITDDEAMAIVASDEPDLPVGSLLHSWCWKEIERKRMGVVCPQCGAIYQVPDGMTVVAESTREAEQGKPRAAYAIWPVDPVTRRPIITEDSVPIHWCKRGVPQ